jgi:hypothetical protein
METKKIQDRTVKDIFDTLIGKENTKKVLTKIQKEYDKGVRGEAFRDFAKSTIEEITDLTGESIKLAVVVTAVSQPHTPPKQPLGMLK